MAVDPAIDEKEKELREFDNRVYIAKKKGENGDFHTAAVELEHSVKFAKSKGWSDKALETAKQAYSYYMESASHAYGLDSADEYSSALYIAKEYGDPSAPDWRAKMDEASKKAFSIYTGEAARYEVNSRSTAGSIKSAELYGVASSVAPDRDSEIEAAEKAYLLYRKALDNIENEISVILKGKTNDSSELFDIAQRHELDMATRLFNVAYDHKLDKQNMSIAANKICDISASFCNRKFYMIKMDNEYSDAKAVLERAVSVSNGFAIERSRDVAMLLYKLEISKAQLEEKDNNVQGSVRDYRNAAKTAFENNLGKELEDAASKKAEELSKTSALH
ncbi:MAG: hypothetical protein M1504_00920 [Candidatus Marsarchaeota archaeon]|nr:hypothetical protein [Candidatus Marsarchaeota archaeon]